VGTVHSNGTEHSGVILTDGMLRFAQLRVKRHKQHVYENAKMNTELIFESTITTTSNSGIVVRSVHFRMLML
jgi:hypothetical protein